MDKQKWTLMGSAGAGAGLGAGLMYLLDPQGGRRRRALARDKAASALNKGGDAVKKTSRDLGNRTRGLVSQVGSRLRQGEDVQVDDKVLCNRVRSKLGHAISHASALEVTAEDGRVTLAGPVLALEADRLLDAVRSVRGVRDVECRFDLHERSEDHPAFQADGSSASRLANRRWVPAATRVLAGTAGGALAVAGFKKQGPLGIALRTVGLSLLAHGVTNAGPGRLASLVRRGKRRRDLSGDGAPGSLAGEHQYGEGLVQPAIL
ncbi:MAG TPA: BON domain-containing protein [Thermoanaerobaculia bacterium]|nr:BON domain-containing protein [Thermoanaerobaculia bacterium]